MTAARLAAFYFAFLAVYGVQLPFWPVWLAAHGLGATDIGVVVAVGVGARLVGNLVTAHVADRSGERRRLMLALAVAGLAAYGLFAFVDGFWGILAVSVVSSLLFPPIMALGESLTMTGVGRFGLDYGRIRLWGSLSFILAAAVSGRVLVEAPPSAILWMVLATVAATALACTLLPDLRTDAAPVAAGLPLARVVQDRGLILMLAAAGLIQGSHAVYYAFGTLHWQAAGISDDVIGLLWAEGVVCEIVLFAAGGAVLRRIRAPWLIAIAGGLAVLRWLVLGTTAALPAVVAVQALHAFSYGAAHLGAIHVIARAVAPALSATAQSLYAALVMGLALGSMLLASGPLYQAFGGGAYFAMALSAGLGCALAVVLARQR
ncbi:MAG: MFS transporter [Rhodospirillales bacterium]|jgi:PPP family 3-phenylpropionic acid transporter|nr:MFS transporter [Rhodospirillales bacterium]